jgi:putative ABC transport system permease protein
MYFLKLIFKNIFRAKLRTGLTILGLVIAILAFGLLQTVVDAFYAGSKSASASRMIMRNAVSLVFPMPISYRDRIKAVDGVRAVTISNWFQGIYKERKNFFAQFAVDSENFFDLYPDFILPPEDLLAFKRDRQGAAVGRKLADQYGWKIGDVLPFSGTIYPGNWQFTVRAIYDGRDETTVVKQFYFHYDYLNEELKKKNPRRADQAGVFIIDVTDTSRIADIARALDAEFKNSLAETLTETEKAFQLSFVQQSQTIVEAIRLVSFVVIIIIMAVVANTMAMTARERLSEYATLKALGFSPYFVAALIFGEALMLCLIGSGIGILLTFPAVTLAGHSPLGSIFAAFTLSPNTVALQAGSAVVLGIVASLVPSIKSARIKIVDGLRHVG